MNVEALGELAAGSVIPRWVKWMGGLIVIAAIMAAIYAYGQQQFDRGEKSKNAEWLARENKELTAANAEIDRVAKEKTAAEAAHQKRLSEQANQYERVQQREKDKTDAVIADLRAGNSGLWYRVASREGSDLCSIGKTVASTSGSDGGAEAKLPRAVAEFLYSEAGRCDAVVRQLNLSQQVIVEYRKTCGY